MKNRLPNFSQIFFFLFANFFLFCLIAEADISSVLDTSVTILVPLFALLAGIFYILTFAATIRLSTKN